MCWEFRQKIVLRGKRAQGLNQIIFYTRFRTSDFLRRFHYSQTRSFFTLSRISFTSITHSLALPNCLTMFSSNCRHQSTSAEPINNSIQRETSGNPFWNQKIMQYYNIPFSVSLSALCGVVEQRREWKRERERERQNDIIVRQKHSTINMRTLKNTHRE
jgi:hypothetical protein